MYHYEIPKLLIDIQSEASIRITGNIDCGDGTIQISMNGGTVNTVGNAALWVNKLEITGAGAIGTPDDPRTTTNEQQRFTAYILDIAAIADTTYQAGFAKRPASLIMEAEGVIVAHLTHVITGPSDGNGGVAFDGADPVLTLSQVDAGENNVDIIFGAPRQLIYDAVEGDQAGSSVTPGSSNNFTDITGGAKDDVIILDAEGNETDYTLTPDGQIKYQGDMIIDLEQYKVIEANDAIPYNYYYLPTGVMLLTDKNGHIVSISESNGMNNQESSDVENQESNGEDNQESNGEDNQESSNTPAGNGYDLQNVRFTTDKDGNRVITFLKDGSDDYIQRVVLGEEVITYIGTSGATLHFEPADTNLGIVLPDGTKVFWTNAFVWDTDEGFKNLTPWVIYDDNGKPLYVLEPMRDANGNVNTGSYHVIRYGENNSFAEGYIYNLELIQSGNTSDMTVGQSAREAEKAIKQALSSLRKNTIQVSAGVTAEEIAQQIVALLTDKITANWQVDVTVTLQTITKQVKVEQENGDQGGNTNSGADNNSGTEINPVEDTGDDDNNPGGDNNPDDDNNPGGGNNPDNEPTYVDVYYLDKILMEISLRAVNSSDEPVYTTDKTFDHYESSELELENQEDTASVSVIGEKQALNTTGMELNNSITNDGRVTVSEGNKLVYQHGYWEFDTRYDETGKFYAIVKPDGWDNLNVFKQAAYNAIKDLLLFYNDGALEIIQMTQIGVGQSTDPAAGGSFNGGYLRDESHVVFIDKYVNENGVETWDTDAYTDGRILYVTDPVAVPVNGSPMILSIRYADKSTDVSDATLVFAPGMELIGHKDGLPIYSANVQKRDANGDYLYAYADGTTVSSTTPWNISKEDPRYEPLISWMKKNSLIPVYETLPGMVIIQPSGNGYNVSYQESGEVTTPVDAHGYAIVSQNIRIYMGENGEIPYGSVLYMEEINGKYEATGIYYLDANGKTVFRKYSNGTFFGGENPVFVEYTEDSVFVSAGINLQAHQVTEGVYMAPVTLSLSTYMLNNLRSTTEDILSADHFHFYTDYFYQTEDGLVQLVPSDLFRYSGDTSLGFGLDGESTFPAGAVCVTYYAKVDGEGEFSNPVVHFLEVGDRIIMVDAKTGNWYDNHGEMGKLAGGTPRSTDPYNQHTVLEMQDMEGENITIHISGYNVTVRGKGADDKVNVTSDNVVIESDNAEFFTKENPLILKPMHGNDVKLQFVSSSGNGPFSGVAYITTQLGETVNVLIHDSIFSSSINEETGATEAGKVVMDILAGNLIMTNVTVKEGATLDVECHNGNAELHGDIIANGTIDLTVSGSVDGNAQSDKLVVGAKGQLKLTANGDIHLNLVTVNAEDENEGSADIRSNEGDISAGAVEIHGNLTVNALKGSFTAESLLISGSETTKSDVTIQTGSKNAGTDENPNMVYGDVTVNGSVAATNSNLTVTSAGAITVGGDIQMTNSTVKMNGATGGFSANSLTATNSNVTIETAEGITLAGDFTASGSIVNMNGAAGGFSANSLTATNSNVTIETAEGITLAGDLTASSDSTVILKSATGGFGANGLTATNSNVTIETAESIALAGNITASSNSTVTLRSAKGSVTAAALNLTNIKRLTIEAAQDIELGSDLIVNNGKVNLSSTNGEISVDGRFSVENGDVTLSAYGDINVAEDILVTGSTLQMTTTNGDVRANNFHANRGSVIITTGNGIESDASRGDVTFGSGFAAENGSTVGVIAAGGIAVMQNIAAMDSQVWMTANAGNFSGLDLAVQDGVFAITTQAGGGYAGNVKLGNVSNKGKNKRSSLNIRAAGNVEMTGDRLETSNGVTVITTTAGNVTANEFVAAEGAQVTITTGDGEDDSDPDGDIRFSNNFTATNSTVQLNAAGSVTVGMDLGANNSTVILNAEGSVAINKHFDADLGTLVITAGGTFTVADGFDAEDSTVVIHAGDDVTVKENFDAENSTVIVNAAGNATITGSFTATVNSQVFITAEEAILVGGNITSTGSTVNLTAQGGGITGKDLTVSDSDFTMKANGHVFVHNILNRDTDPDDGDISTLVIDAAGSITAFDAQTQMSKDITTVGGTTNFIAMGGNVEGNNFVAENSTVTIRSEGNAIFSGAFTADMSTVVLKTAGSIDVTGAITAENSFVTMETVDGNVSGKDFAATGSEVTIIAGNGSINRSRSVGIVDPEGDVFFDGVFEAMDSTVAIRAAGSFRAALDIMIRNSDITMTTGGNVSGKNFTAENSDVTIHAASSSTEGNVFFDGAFEAEDSTVVITAAGEIRANGNITSTNSTLHLTAQGGGVTGKDLTVTDSDVIIKANGNVSVHTISNVDTDPDDGDISTLIIDAAGSITARDNETQQNKDITTTAGITTLNAKGGNVEGNTFAADDSNVSVYSNGSILLTGAFNAKQSLVTLQAAGSIDVAEDMTAENSKVTMTAENGNVTGNRFTAHNSEVSIDVGNGNVTFRDEFTVTDSIMVTIRADGSITVGQDMVILNSTVVLTTEDGNLEAIDLLVRDSMVTIRTGDAVAMNDVLGTVTFRSIQSENTTLDIRAAGTITLHNTNGTTDVVFGSQNDAYGYDSTHNHFTDSTVTMETVDGNVIAKDLLAKDSIVKIIAGNGSDQDDISGDVILHRIYSDNTDFQVHAAGDFRFDNLLAMNASNIDLYAGNTVGMRQNGGIDCGEHGIRAFIKLLDAASTLSISALRSVGDAPAAGYDPDNWKTHTNRLIIDVPEQVTMPIVGDIWVDALELLPKYMENDVAQDITMGNEELRNVILTQLAQHPENPKDNKFDGINPDDPNGDLLDGDHLEMIREVLEQVTISNQTPEELAAWIVSVLNDQRDVWANDDVLVRSVIETLLGSELDNELILTILKRSDLVDQLTETEIQQLARALSYKNLNTITNGTEVASHVSDQALETIFSRLTASQKQILGLDDTATSITRDQLAQLLDQGGMTMRDALQYAEAAFLADLKLRQDARQADKILTGILVNGGQEDIYDSILASLKDGTASDAAAQAMLTKLIALQMAELTGSADSESEEEIPGANTLHDLGALLGSLLTEEDIKELYRQAIENSDLSDDLVKDSNPRDFHLVIGSRTQYTDTTIYNEGNITILQNDSDFTATTIKSERENVTIDVRGGSIWADQDTNLHIYGADIKLTASGNVGSSESVLVLEQSVNRPIVVPGVLEDLYFDADYIGKIEKFEAGETTFPEFTVTLGDLEYILRLMKVEILSDDTDEETDDETSEEPGTEPEKKYAYIWVLDVMLRHDWIREDFPAEATRLDVTAGGDVYLMENTGNIGLGQVDAGGNVTITAPDSILDTRSDVEMAAGRPNIHAENAFLTAQDGTIGTEERPILVALTGTLNDMEAQGDVDVDAIGSLTSNIDSIDGKLDISAEMDLTITNTGISNGGTGNMILDNLLAGGSVDVTAVGSILGQSEEDSDKDIEAGYNISLKAGANIGDREDALRIDSAQSGYGNVKGYGDVSAFGVNITLQETDGDLTIEKIVGTGDVKLDIPTGGLTDTTDSLLDDVAAAQRAADIAKNLATSAMVAVDSKKLIADAIAEKLSQAQEKLDKLNETIDELNEQLSNDETLTDEQREEIQKRLDEMAPIHEKMEDQVQELRNAYSIAQTDVEEAMMLAAEAQLNADNAQAAVAKIAQERLDDLRDAVTQAEIMVDSTARQLADEGPARKQAAEEAAQQLPAAQLQLETVQNQIAELEQLVQQLNEQLEQMRQEAEKNEDEDEIENEEALAALEDQIQKVENQLQDLESEEEEKQMAIETLQGIMDAYTELVFNAKVAEEELAEAKQRLKELSNQLDAMADAETDAQDLRNEADSLQAEADRELTEAEALKDAAEEAQNKRTELQQLNETIGNLQDQLADPSLTEEEKLELQQELDDLVTCQGVLDAEERSGALQKAIDDYNAACAEYEAAQKLADEADRVADNAESLIDHLHHTNDLAASEQIEADEYQMDANEAMADAIAKQAYADSLKSDAEEAEEQIPEMQEELEDVEAQIEDLREQLTDPELTQQEYNDLMNALKPLKKELKKLQDALAEQMQAVADYNEAQQNADEAAARAQKIQQQADTQQKQVEEMKPVYAPFYAAGNLDITAQDDVGEDDPLDIRVDGEVNVESADGDISISHSAHMNLGNITGENVELNTSGDIRPTDSDSGIHTGVQDDPETEEDESETETEAQINALGSSAGTNKRPLRIDTDRISGTSGDNINIQIPGDVIVDTLTAGNELKLTVGGDMIAGQGDVNIAGGDIVLNADNIGSKKQPLSITLIPQADGSQGLSTNSGNTYLNVLGDLIIRDVNGKDVSIESNGRVDGADDNGQNPDVTAENLYISAKNGVGTRKNPLIICVSGIVEIASEYGSVFFINIYRQVVCCCRCQFWDMVVERIMEAEEGETVEILEVVHCSRMPEKVMRALRERDDVTLILHLEDGSELIIEAGTALDEEPGVECYDMNWLLQYYMG